MIAVFLEMPRMAIGLTAGFINHTKAGRISFSRFSFRIINERQVRCLLIIRVTIASMTNRTTKTQGMGFANLRDPSVT